MHPSSIENMQICRDRYVPYDAEAPRRRLVEVGSYDVNGSYRGLFPETEFDYVGVDIEAGPGVSIVLDDPYTLPFHDRSVDVVISGQTFEHNPRFWDTFREMSRIAKDDGYIFLIAPSAGPIHRHPIDCYRFQPDSYAALAEIGECELVECWMDEREPWHDLVGVFRPRPRTDPR